MMTHVERITLIIKVNLKLYGNTIEMNQLSMLLSLLLIFLLIIITTEFCLNLKQKYQAEQATMGQIMLK